MRLLAFFLLLFVAFYAQAQPPNDNFASALDISSSINGCTSGGANFTTVGATADQARGSCWDNGPNYNVWFKFVATTSFINVQIQVNTNTLQYPFLALWSNSSTQLACMDQNGSNINTSLSYLGLTVGAIYYISVDNYSGTGYRGTFDLCLSDAVDYDYPQGAKLITSTSCSSGGTYTTLYASADHNPGTCWNNGPNYSRWFKFIATTNFINIQALVSSNTMQYPFIALWDATFIGQLACMNQNGSKTNTSLSYLGLTVGNTYYISVDNYAGTGYRGSFDLCLSDQVDYDYPQGAKLITSTTCTSGGTYTTLYASPDDVKGNCWDNGPNYNRWFTFTATTNFVNIQVLVASNTMQYPFVALWDGTFTGQLACMDQNGSKTNISLSYLGLTVGNTYYISVDNYIGGYRGSFDLCLTDQVDYDYPQGAKSITSTTCTSGGTYTTLYATPDNVKGNCWDNGPNYNRWFKFVATTNFINIQTLVSANTMQYPFVALWDGTFTGQLACMDQNGSKTNTSLSYLGLTVGITYYISVDNYAGTGYRGSFDLCLTDQVDYDYPQGAKSITSTTCTSGGTYTTLYATPDNVKGNCWDNGPNYNRWFKFVATTSFINIQVNVSSNTMQYPFVALWDGTFTGQLACMDQNGSKTNTSLSYLGLTIGNTYYISVDNYVGTGYRGSFDLCLTDQVDYDYPLGAKDITTLINSCSSGGAYSTLYATPDDSKGGCWDNGPNYNRWFKFQATSTGFINIQVKVNTNTMQYPFVALWDGTFTGQLACVDQNGSKTDVNVSYVGLTPGVYYYISVDNYAGTGYRGSFDLCLTDVPDYDFYIGAVSLTNLNNWCSSNAAYSTLYATPDKSRGTCWANGPNNNRWFKFVAITPNATIQLSTGGAAGTLQYPYMALWQSNGTTQIGCAQYTSQYSPLSIVTSALVVGNTYYISVDNYTGGGYAGSFKLCVNNIGTTFYSRASGPWNTNNTWSTATYGGAIASSFPNAGDVALISGYDVTVSSNQQAAEVDLTVATANTSLTVDNSTLAVNGLVSLTNSGNNFNGSITVQNNGSLSINDVLNVSRSGGNQVFGINVNTGCSLSVNTDMNWTSSGGTVNNSLLTVNGTGTVSVSRDVNLTSTGGPLTKLQFNNSSVFSVLRDINFTANAGGLESIELNTSAKLRVGRNMVRGGTPYGILACNNSSTVEFNGGVYPQTIGGDAGAGGDSFSYMNVILNNTSPSSPKLSLGGSTTVNGNLTLTAGILVTTATNILNLKNASTTTLGSSSSFVNGPMTYEVATNTANTVRNLPLGKNSDYRPAVLTVTHSDNTSVIYTAEHFSSSAAALGYSLPGTDNKVSGLRYWQIDRAAVSNLTTATVQLYYGIGTSDGVTDYTNLTVVKNVGVGTSWIDIGGTATGNGTGSITSGAFTSFCKFTIANKAVGINPLPIELMSFEAAADGSDVDLKWVTASELNNDYFTVERSKDGFEFTTVAIVQGAGTKSTQTEYGTVDHTPYEGISYYRLKQTDFSGTSSFSGIVKVDRGLDLAPAIVAFPNPSDGSDVVIRATGFDASEELGVQVVDLFGKSLLSFGMTTSAEGTSDVTWKASTLPARGLYIILVNSKKGRIATRLVIR
jgi:hypothetical protein